MKRIKRNQRRGAVIVEMALTLPLFFMVVLGIVEFGRAMMVSQLLTNAAREGARLAILSGNTNEDVENAVTEFLELSANIDAGVVTVNISITPAAGNPDPGGQIANAQSRDLCSISVQVPFDEVSYIRADYLAGKSLVGTCAMRHE
ncbi:MAG: TadE/TadG family type IV pilus assembly protein [Planctomycetaceae bacterium]